MAEALRRQIGTMHFDHFKRFAVAACCQLLLTMATLCAAGAAECVAASDARRVALLELYTSEGCSSCPPADQWMSALAGRKFVPGRLLPLAFHVDYWNDLGWTDPFSQAKFSDRQRQHSRRRGASFVVTPQLLLDGLDYQRPLLWQNIEGKADAINRTAPRADIRLTQRRSPGQIDASVDVRIAATVDRRDARLFLALYENNLVSTVKAGENRGALLHHDFVVRELLGPFAFSDVGRLRHDAGIRIDPGWKPADLQLAAFVQHARTGEVLQALSAACR
jgi:hypothetical protein